jgi:hypothetical protein
MKKIILILFIVGALISLFYLVFKNVDDDEIIPVSSIDFSSLHPDVVVIGTGTPDIVTLLNEPISPALRSVVNVMYRDNYHVFTCKSDLSEGQILILTAQYDGSIARDGYDGAYQKIKDWEKNAVAEIGHIIFPSLATQTTAINFVWFEPYTINNPHISASRDFHKALFYIGDYPYEMHYGWILNYLIFAPSQACLEDIMMGLYHSH